MVIRKEQPEDYDLTDSVVKKAFMQAEYSDKTEQALVKALGKSSACIPELSLAAETDGKIAGFIMFTRAWIGDSEILALAPLAVLPEYQRRGIRTALIKERHKIGKCSIMNIRLYWEVRVSIQRYLPADTFGITAPFDVPRKNYMVCK